MVVCRRAACLQLRAVLLFLAVLPCAGQKSGLRQANLNFFDSRIQRGHTTARRTGPGLVRGIAPGPPGGRTGTIYSPLGPLTPPQPGDAETIARRFLEQTPGGQAVHAASLLDLPLVARYESRQAHLIHLVFEPRSVGVPFFGSLTQAHLGSDGRLWRVHRPNLPTVSGAPAVVLDQQEAVQAALRALRGTATPALQVTGEERGPDRRVVLSSPALTGPVPASLVWFPVDDTAVASWQLYLELDGAHAYWVVVNAQDGDILFSQNLARELRPEGLVFPAPATAHPDEGDRVTQPFTGWPAAAGDCPADIYPSEFWAGAGKDHCWVASNETLGNNVDACYDEDGNNLCDGRAAAADGSFAHPFADSYALTGDPLPDRAAAVTNAFYWTNVAHDWLYRLGFDEPSGNFQADNFGRGGAPADPLRVDVHDGSVPNASTFLTPPDGIAPRLQLGLYQGLARDAAFDGDIILHEYVHGLTSRLIGGPTSVTGLFRWQSGALSEGWSDALAVSFTGDPRFAEYTSRNPSTGFRSVAHDNSSYTFGQFGTQFRKAIPNTGGMLLGLPQVHRDGEIWATALWDLRAELGQDNFEQAVVTALKLTPPRPSMLDARDAILQAAQALGLGECRLWEVFAQRGFGASAALNPIEANQENDTALSVFEAFDVPPACGGGPPTIEVFRLEEDAEAGVSPWTPTGLWHRTSWRAAAGSRAWWFGDEATGSYQTGERVFGRLLSGDIDLQAASQAVVAWDQFFAGEGFGAEVALGGGVSAPYLNADSGRLLLSTDGGTHWRTITTLAHDSPPDRFVHYRVNLSRFVGQSIRLAFEFDTFDDQSNDHEGWYLDNIVVSGTATNETRLEITPGALSFSSRAGGPYPGPQTATVTSFGEETVPWSASVVEGSSWLAVTPLASVTPEDVTVSVAPAGLPAGVYAGRIRFAPDSQPDAVADLDVALTVEAAVPFAAWAFEETGSGAGVPVADRSGNGHHGQAHGYGSIPVPGVSGRGRLFNGASDYVEVSPPLDLESSSFTVSTWVNLLSYPANLGVILSSYGGNYSGWYLAVNPEGRVVFLASQPPDTARWLVSQSTLRLESWHAISVTLDRATGLAVLYVDGAAESQHYLPGLAAANSVPLTMARASWYDGYYLNCLLDEIEIVPVARTAAEVLADVGALVPPAATPAPSLGAIWKFDDGAGDYSGNGHDGVLVGGQPVDGISGQAWRFDGQSGYFTLPSSYRLTPAGFTWSGWMKLDSYPGSLGIIYADYGGDHQGWYVAVRSDGQAVFSVSKLPGTSEWILSNSKLQLDRWYLLTVTYGGPSRRASVYVNGVREKQVVLGGLTQQAGGVVTMGKSSWHDGYYLAGDLDEVRLEPRVLSAAEIEVAFSSGALAAVPPPIAEWLFEDTGTGAGSAVTDRSGNGHHAFIEDGETTVVAGRAGLARRFEGYPEAAALTPDPRLSPASFSFATWLRLSAYPGSWGVIFSSYDGNYRGWHCSVNASGQLVFSVASPPASAPWLLSPEPLELERWYHVAFTFEDTSRRAAIYADGVLVRTAVFPAFAAETTLPLTFGRASWYRGAYLSAAFDEARLYATALSETELLTEMQRGLE